jgi:hypothetical protein
MSPVDKLSIALRLYTYIFFYNPLAILAKMQQPGNVTFTTLKNNN